MTFTPDAHAELHQRIAAFGKRKHVILVLWMPPQLDLVRSAEGKAVWKEEHSARWAVSVEVLPGNRCETEEEKLGWPEEHLRWMEERLLHVGDLRVYFSPEGSGATEVTVAYINGKFRVQRKDA